jgi:SSS family solute:Na+ symporter
VSLPLTVLLAYALVQIGLGLWLGRRTRSASDFLVAGRGLGPGLLFATLLAANIGAGSTVGATGLGYRDGLSAWWWVGSAALGSAVLAFAVGPAARRLAERHDLRTVGDFLDHRYGPSVRAAAALLVCLGSLAILAGQLIAMAWLLFVVAGVPKPMGCLIGGTVVTSYFAAGGLLTSARLNVLQLVVKLAGLLLAVPFAVAHAGGWPALQAAGGADAGYWNPWGNGPSGLVYLALLAPAFVASPGLLQKVFAARDDAAVRWGVGLNALGLLLYAGVPVVLGMAARAAFPRLESPELALPTLLLHGAPVLVGSLGLAAVFSAEVSAADAVLFMVSTSLTQDGYRRFVNPAASEQRLLRVARASAVAAGAVATVLAVALPTVIGALGIFYTLITVSLFVPVVAGVSRGRFGEAEALSAMGAGVGVAVAAQLLGLGLPVLAGTAAAVLAFVLVAAVRSRSTTPA